jgi:RNA-binding protein YhbY
MLISIKYGLCTVHVKFIDFKDEKLEVAQKIALETNSFFVRIIGNVAIFYRKSSEPAKRACSKMLKK